jgi:hypothetical protein
MKSHGRIVSAKKHKTAKKELRLQKYGYFAQKGKFGYVKKSSSRKSRKSMKKRGGSALAPATVTEAYANAPTASAAVPTAKSM